MGSARSVKRSTHWHFYGAYLSTIQEKEGEEVGVDLTFLNLKSCQKSINTLQVTLGSSDEST